MSLKINCCNIYSIINALSTLEIAFYIILCHIIYHFITATQLFVAVIAVILTNFIEIEGTNRNEYGLVTFICVTHCFRAICLFGLICHTLYVTYFPTVEM